MPTSWSDNFSTNNFTGGVNYSLLSGSGYSVSPGDLSVPGGANVLWQDQRLNFASIAGSGTLLSTLGISTTYSTSFPYFNCTGWADPTTGQYILLCGYVQGQFGVLATDAVPGGAFSGSASNMIAPVAVPGPLTVTVSVSAGGVYSVTDGTNTVTGTFPAGFLADASLITAGGSPGLYPMGAMYGLDGSFSPLASDDFIWTYGPQGPSISSVIPNLLVAAGGETLQITGSDLTGATGVTIGGSPVSFVFNSPTSITIPSAPAGVAGTSAHTVVTTTSGVTGTSIADLVKWVGHIANWADDFSIDHFPLGDDDYTVLAGTEGGSFTVSPQSLSFAHSSTVTWEDQRTYQIFPFQSTLALTSGPSPTFSFGLADGQFPSPAVAILVVVGGGNLYIKTIDPIDGTQTLGSVSFTPPVLTNYELRLKADSSTLAVYSTTPITDLPDPGTLLTSVSTPANLTAAIAANVVVPIVTGTN